MRMLLLFCLVSFSQIHLFCGEWLRGEQQWNREKPMVGSYGVSAWARRWCWITVVAMGTKVEGFQDSSWGASVKKGRKQGDSQVVFLSEWEDGNAISFKAEDHLMWQEELWKPQPRLQASPTTGLKTSHPWNQGFVKFERWLHCVPKNTRIELGRVVGIRKLITTVYWEDK